MYRIVVQNIRETEGERRISDGFAFTYKPVIAPTSPDANQCHIAFVEVPPGSRSFPYHYHETDEEAFYIIRGEGVIRTHNGDLPVRAGDIATFPAGPDGAHSIRNESETETLAYIDFDTHNLPEITHFPDSGRVEVLGAFSSAVYEEGLGEKSGNQRTPPDKRSAAMEREQRS